MGSKAAGPSRSSGFTLVEVLVVVTILAVLALLSFPALQRMILRSKLEGAARQTSALVRLARLEAIKRGRPATVELDPAARRVVLRSAGRQLAAYELPASVHFWSAGDGRPVAASAIVGLSTVDGRRAVVVNPDGSVEETGAIRFGSGPFPRSGGAESDRTRNFLEVRIDPQATARVTVRKYNAAVPSGPAYYEPGNHPATGQPLWEWY